MEKPVYPSPRKLSSLTFCYLVSDLFDGSHCGTGQLVTFPSVIDKCAICNSFFDLLLWQVDNFWNKQLQTPVRMAQALFGWCRETQTRVTTKPIGGKEYIIMSRWKLRVKRGKTRATVSRAVLTLHLIGWVVSTSFLSGPITERL